MLETFGITCSITKTLEGGSQSKFCSRKLSSLSEALSKSKQSQDSHANTFRRATIQVRAFLYSWKKINNSNKFWYLTDAVKENVQPLLQQSNVFNFIIRKFMATRKNKCQKSSEVSPTHLMHTPVVCKLSPWVNIFSLHKH